MELAIDTSTPDASIAFSSEGQIIAELTWHSGQNHTLELMPNLSCLLRLNELTVKDIGGIAVARGPGSFNGLRVGLSAAKGLAFALNVPLVGISTLEVEAFPLAASTLPICPISNAGRGEIATAIFQLINEKWCRVLEEHIATIDSLVSTIRGPTIFCGRIESQVKSVLRERLGTSALIVEGAGSLRRAGYLAELGWRRLSKGDYDLVATLQPLYLRNPSITISSHRH